MFDEVDLRLEIDVRTDPLPIQVNACDRISVITAHYPVRIKNRNEDEGVEFSQETGLFAIRAEEVKHAFEDYACWGLTRVDT